MDQVGIKVVRQIPQLFTLYLGTKALHSKSSFLRCLERSGVNARPRTRLGPPRKEATPPQITHSVLRTLQKNVRLCGKKLVPETC